MKLELVKKTEIDDTGVEKIWWVVHIGSIQKHHHTEESAREYYTAVKNHHSKFGTIEPNIEIILSEELKSKRQGELDKLYL